LYDILVLALENRHKGSNALSIRSTVVDKERMMPGHWLGLVLCVPFSALILLAAWQEGHLSHENLDSLISRGYRLEQVE